MLTYQVEKFVDVFDEALPLLKKHWEEVANDKAVIKLEPDVKAYVALEEAGLLHIVTVRQDGELVGYHASFVKPHIHYMTSLTAFTDIYFVKPDRRASPLIAIRLFEYTEKTLRDRGVQRIIMPAKVHMGNGRLFERLGYRETERVFTKILEG